MTVSYITAEGAPLLDYKTEVSKGNVPGQEALTISGTNPSLAIGTEDLWAIGGSLQYLATERRIKLVSTSANDTAGGTGVRTVLISGQNDAGVPQSDVITMNGLSDSAFSSNNYAVVNFMFALSSGTLLTNDGLLTAIAETDLTPQCGIRAGVGISQHGFTRVPAGKSIVINSLEFNASKVGGGQEPVVLFRIYARFSRTSPWVTIAERTLDAGVQDSIIVPLDTSATLSEGADVRFAATTDQNGTFASSRLIGILYDN